ncbi:hypothetical protein Hanom_Chr15g01395231 [Helianthus anomalus]
MEGVVKEMTRKQGEDECSGGCDWLRGFEDFVALLVLKSQRNVSLKKCCSFWSILLHAITFTYFY